MAETSDLSGDQQAFVAARIREELARRRISRQMLADDARISLSTLEKALAGHRPFTLATLVRLEEALGVRLREAEAGSGVPGDNGSSLAPEELGGYSRASVSWLEGRYLTLRPSFSDPDAVFSYCTEIGWSAASSCLIFQESDRVDRSFTQRGRVSVPNMSGHIYLTTNIFGQYRLIIVSRPAISGEMYGVLTTLQAGRGANLMPVSTSIVFVPQAAFEIVEYGRMTKASRCWPEYRAYVERALDEAYVGFFTGRG